MQASTMRSTRRVALLPAGLATVVLIVASAAWWENRTASDLPQRITIQSRDYHIGARSNLADAQAGVASWRQVATVGSHERPAFAGVSDGYLPTVVYVQLGPDTYESYDLLGGP